MKNVTKLLLATAIASAPFLNVGEASADGSEYEYGPRFGQVDAKFLDTGDLQLGFEQTNIKRQWIRYSMEADLQSQYRCLDRRGQYAGGVITRRNQWRDARAFQASRQGHIQGQFVMPRDHFRGRDVCRNNHERPVLMRVQIVDLRLLDETNNQSHYRDRVTCDSHGAGYGYDVGQTPQFGGKGEVPFVPGKTEEDFNDQYDAGQDDGQFDAGQDDGQYDAGQDDGQYDVGPVESQYAPGKGGGQVGVGKGGAQLGVGKGDAQLGVGKGEAQFGVGKAAPSKGGAPFQGK